MVQIFCLQWTRSGVYQYLRFTIIYTREELEVGTGQWPAEKAWPQHTVKNLLQICNRYRGGCVSQMIQTWQSSENNTKGRYAFYLSEIKKMHQRGKNTCKPTYH